MNTHAPVRRAVVAVTICSFSIAALMGIAALLSSSTFGETAVRVLVTTVVVGCASVVTLACLVPIDSRWSFASVGGVLVTVATAAFALLMVWVSTDSWDEGAFRALGIGITASLTVAQMCLLLGVGVRRPSISPSSGSPLRSRPCWQASWSPRSSTGTPATPVDGSSASWRSSTCSAPWWPSRWASSAPTSGL